MSLSPAFTFGDAHPEPPRAFLHDDGGRSLSAHPWERDDCTVRSFAIATQLPYDQAWDEMVAAGRPPLDGFDPGDWYRRVGWVRDYNVPSNVTLFRYITLQSIKGHRRIYAVDIPQAFPKGRYVFNTHGHIEAWVDGVHHETPDSFRKLAPGRMFYGGWQAHKLPVGAHIWDVFKVYLMAGQAYRSKLGVVVAQGPLEHPGTIAGAYNEAARVFEHAIGTRKADMLVEYAATV